jgi:ribosomal 30S subunit maturation factor RimM
MDSSTVDFVGLEAYSRDGGKIGKVKEVLRDPDSASDCLVIKYGLFRDLIVPADVIEKQGTRVSVPFNRNFLDTAPRIPAKGQLTSEQRARVERFFHPGG